eukprot:TRINITY_DN13407_c0_g1_i1.p1 TRINITY_DN13407_c0_g1~~TRINITY_DN13407_c0_g1_i1.p1  ORF type:complete len:609 (-),score=154.09 TRINITY_DN13407_c0_g1_i1:135-1961(-)
MMQALQARLEADPSYDLSSLWGDELPSWWLHAEWDHENEEWQRNHIKVGWKPAGAVGQAWKPLPRYWRVGPGERTARSTTPRARGASGSGAASARSLTPRKLPPQNAAGQDLLDPWEATDRMYANFVLSQQRRSRLREEREALEQLESDIMASRTTTQRYGSIVEASAQRLHHEAKKYHQRKKERVTKENALLDMRDQVSSMTSTRGPSAASMPRLDRLYRGHAEKLTRLEESRQEQERQEEDSLQANMWRRDQSRKVDVRKYWEGRMKEMTKPVLLPAKGKFPQTADETRQQREQAVEKAGIKSPDEFEDHFDVLYEDFKRRQLRLEFWKQDREAKAERQFQLDQFHKTEAKMDPESMKLFTERLYKKDVQERAEWFAQKQKDRQADILQQANERHKPVEADYDFAAAARERHDVQAERSAQRRAAREQHEERYERLMAGSEVFRYLTKAERTAHKDVFDHWREVLYEYMDKENLRPLDIWRIMENRRKKANGDLANGVTKGDFVIYVVDKLSVPEEDASAFWQHMDPQFRGVLKFNRFNDFIESEAQRAQSRSPSPPKRPTSTRKAGTRPTAGSDRAKSPRAKPPTAVKGGDPAKQTGAPDTQPKP